jgi:hypothetical protein
MSPISFEYAVEPEKINTEMMMAIKYRVFIRLPPFV